MACLYTCVCTNLAGHNPTTHVSLASNSFQFRANQELTTYTVGNSAFSFCRITGPTVSARSVLQAVKSRPEPIDCVTVALCRKAPCRPTEPGTQPQTTADVFTACLYACCRSVAVSLSYLLHCTATLHCCTARHSTAPHHTAAQICPLPAVSCKCAAVPLFT